MKKLHRFAQVLSRRWPAYLARSSAALIVATLILIANNAQAQANTYYVSPTGNDGQNGTSQASAWATFDRAWRSMRAGDTLVLLDGTYRQSLTPSLSGTPAAPVTVRALNDGKAIIDGEYRRTPVEFGHTRPAGGANFVVEGIVAKNSSGDVWYIRSANVTLRRVSGYNAAVDENSSIFTFWTDGGGLLEDCVAVGTGRKAILLYQTKNITVRRCYARFDRWDGRNFCGVTWPNSETVEIYNGENNLLENVIVTGPSPTWLLAVQANGDQAVARNNQVLGSIAHGAGVNEDGSEYDYGPRPMPSSCGQNLRDFTWPNQRAGVALWGQGIIENNVFRDLLAVGNAALGFTNDKPYGRGAVGTILDHATIHGNGAYAPSGDGGTGAQVKLNGIVPTNSKIAGTQYQGEGVRLANRYVDGTLTDEALWPWPMESRIQDELGFSVTDYVAELINLRDFVISVSPAINNVQGGETLEIKVTITPRGGFDAPVTITVDPLPEGVSVSPGSATLQPPGATTFTLELDESLRSEMRTMQTITFTAGGEDIERKAEVTLIVSGEFLFLPMVEN